MVLKLYGFHLSAYTRSVAIVLHEKQVPFEFIQIELPKKEQKNPEYLKKQPFGKVPYIDDDGFILYESRAIARYIEAKYPDQGTSLIPKDPKANALFEQAVSIESFNFDPNASKAVFENLIKKYQGLTPDPAAFEAAISVLDKNLDVYDQILGKQRYLAGDELTLADLFHVPWGSLLPVAGSNILGSKPNVDRWFKELAGRASCEAYKDGVKTTVEY